MITRTISIQTAVLNAMQDMGINISDDIPVFTRWALECERYVIGSHYSMCTFVETLTVKGRCAEIPCNAMYVKRVLIGDYQCSKDDVFDQLMCSSISAQSFVTDKHPTFLVIDKPEGGVNFNMLSNMKWSLQAGKIVFPNDMDGKKITVQMVGLDKDDFGFPKVIESHTLAITEYIMYKYGIRSRFTPNKMPAEDVRFHQSEYTRLSIDARASDSELSETDRAQIIEMIHDPFIGYGFEVGMHNKNDFFAFR